MKQKHHTKISSYLASISRAISPRTSSSYNTVYVLQPIHYASLEYELYYLVDPSSTTYQGEWYPLYFSPTVLVPPPITKTLTIYEKRHRLQLLYQALVTIDTNHVYGMFFSILYRIGLIYFLYILYQKYHVSWITLLLVYYIVVRGIGI